MGNEWQVVQPKARSKSGKGKGSTNNLANGGVKEAGDVALAKLDADWNSKGKNDKPNGTSTSSAFNSLEVGQLQNQGMKCPNVFSPVLCSFDSFEPPVNVRCMNLGSVHVMMLLAWNSVYEAQVIQFSSGDTL